MSDNSEEAKSEVFVFLDETTYKDKWVGVGILVMKEQVAPVLIENALRNLANDDDSTPDELAKSLDSKTISRGYFHSIEDSKNTRSFLAKEIKANINGTFHFSYSPVYGEKDLEKRYRRETMLALMKEIKGSHTINLFFEERSTFKIDACNTLLRELFNRLDENVALLPKVPIIYPEIKTMSHAKTEPANQITDFILWCANIQILDPGDRKAVWLGRAGGQQLMLSKIEPQKDHNQPFSKGAAFGSINLGAGLIDDYVKLLEIYPSDVDFRLANEQFGEYYLLAERTIHRTFRTGLPVHAHHLRGQLSDLIAKLRNAPISEPDKIALSARMYIRLFDTVPLYRGLDKSDDEFAILLRVRYCMSLVLSNQIQGLRIRNLLAGLRRDLIDKKPASLFED